MKSNKINSIVKVVIFEDSKFDLTAIKTILNDIPEVQIVGSYDVLKEALRKCKELKPDLIIVDADIRGDKKEGPRFAQNMRMILPNVKMLGLTKYSECLQPLKQAGCKEAVLKHFFDDSEAARKYIQETLLELPAYYQDDTPPELSIEEDHVLRMIANGRTENEIAQQLDKTRRQVKDIKESLKLKFGVSSNRDPQLIAHAYRIRYLNSDEDLSQY